MKLAISTQNSDQSAISTKDRLFDLLNSSWDQDGRVDKVLYLDRAQQVMFVLDTVQGMIQELRYAYKAVDILTRIQDDLREFLNHCSHAVTIRRILEVQAQAQELGDRFYALQMAAMDPANPDNLLAV